VPAAPVEVAAPPPYCVMMCVSDRTAGPGLATLASALLGKRDEPARLFALHLYGPSDRPSVEQRRSAGGHDGDDTPLEPLLERARDLALEVRPLSFVSTEPAVDIVRTAGSVQASIVLLGAHKPLLLEGTLGGTVRDVLRDAPSAVGVFSDRGLEKVARVLVVYAGAEDVATLQVARRLASAPGATLTLLHVVPPGAGAQPGRGRAKLDELLAEPGVDAGVVRVQVVEHESPPDAVLAEAERGYDLLVVGMQPRRGLGLVGLRRRRVLAEAGVSVLAVHPPPGLRAPAVELPESAALSTV
jgi:nucleotide-binding universal stress UspA family protein